MGNVDRLAEKQSCCGKCNQRLRQPAHFLRPWTIGVPFTRKERCRSLAVEPSSLAIEPASNADFVVRTRQVAGDERQKMQARRHIVRRLACAAEISPQARHRDPKKA